jgi:hypothetical protein
MKENEVGGACGMHRREFTRFWRKGPKKSDHMEDRGAYGKMGSKCILGRLVGGVWSGFTWLRIGAGGGLL